MGALMRNQWKWIAGLTIAALIGGGAWPRQGWSQTTLQGGVSQTEYTDEYAKTCEQQNQNNPYVGMNPFECYGEMAPTDSRGQCSLNIGTVWKQVGNTCYYCAPINPPIQGFILPLDQVHVAGSQGWGCGANQTDACTAICYGGKTFSPPPGTTVVGGGPGLPPTPPPPQGGPPPGYAPTPGPAGGIGYVPGANPCLPQGPGGYDYCQNGPGARLPAGCVCSESQPRPPLEGDTSSSPPSSNPVADAGQYLQGVAAGFGSCFKGFGDLAAGAGFFAQGDFVDAAKAWGLSPGQSVLLKTMYAELTAPVVGQGVTPYEAGMTAGRRLCQYAVVPGAAKAAGTVLKGAISPGSTVTNPLKGSALQDAINSDPQSLANKWVQTGNGPVQLGGYAGQGSFASVFRYGTNKVIKLSRSNPETLGYGPQSIEGQYTGAGRVQAAGVETPSVSNLEPGGGGNPASLVADDVAQKYPGSFQISNAKYHSLPAAEQGPALNAVTNATNQIAKTGSVLLDVNPSNFSLQGVGNAFKAILLDPDMVLTPTEIGNLAADSVPRGVLNYALDVAGEPNFLNQPFTAESLTNVLNIARERLITGITNVGGSTVKPPTP